MSTPLESFEPRLEALPAPQQDLWAELQRVPSGLVLYEGTALALRLARRTSVDFEFFSTDPLDRRGFERLSFMKSAQVLQDEPDALTVSVNRSEPVKVSFFGPVGFGRVGTPQLAGRLPVASLLDLAATKIKVLLQRVEVKDYFDMAAVLRTGLPLEDVLCAARTLFGDAFNPLIAQKTLSWFQGAGLDGVDPASREMLSRAALQDVDLPPMALRSERLDR